MTRCFLLHSQVTLHWSVESRLNTYSVRSELQWPQYESQPVTPKAGKEISILVALVSDQRAHDEWHERHFSCLVSHFHRQCGTSRDIRHLETITERHLDRRSWTKEKVVWISWFLIGITTSYFLFEVPIKVGQLRVFSSVPVMKLLHLQDCPIYCNSSSPNVHHWISFSSYAPSAPFSLISCGCYCHSMFFIHIFFSPFQWRSPPCFSSTCCLLTLYRWHNQKSDQAVKGTHSNA